MELTNIQKAALTEIARRLERNFDCMDVTLAYGKLADADGAKSIDWHPVAFHLDSLRAKGILKIVQPGEYTKYNFIA